MIKYNYIVAATKPWSIKAYNEFCGNRPNWFLVTCKDDLNLDYINQIQPKYIFFPHWSWLVPSSITDSYECVCFHMTDVPFGRGGSPLQNLIVRGFKETMLTALKMTKVLDAGPVYLKEPLLLSGSANEIFYRAASKIMELALHISENTPLPAEQVGEVTYFERRTPSQSQLNQDMTLKELYDQIRMLDADTYPKAFLKFGKYRFEFDNAKLSPTGELEARVKIKRTD